MQQRGIERYAPLAGVVFLVLVILSFIIGGEPPAADESTEETVRFWADNDAENVIAAILGAIACVALVWFGGSLRRALLRAEGGDGRLAAIAYGGIVIAAAGGGVNSSLQFAAAEVADETPGEVTHAISAVYAHMWFPFTIGFALMLLGAAVVALRYGGVIPSWLAWVSIVIAVMLMTPAGFVGFLASMLWIAAVGVMLYLAHDRAQAAQPAAPPPTT